MLPPPLRGRAGPHDGLSNPASPSRARKVCTQFKIGKCAFGSRCRYSHDLRNSHEDTICAGENPPSEDEVSVQQRYFALKRLLRGRNSAASRISKSPREIIELWDGALGILNASYREQHQQLARDLVDDELDGHKFILSTMDMSISDPNFLLSSADSFLKVITHSSFLECLSVDAFVGSMYTSFGGTNGNRAVGFLEYLCQLISETPQSTKVVNLLGLFPKALFELLSRDRQARLNDDIPGLVDRLDALVSKMTEGQARIDVEASQVKLTNIRRLVANANGNLGTYVESAVKPDAHSFMQSNFPLELEFPGGRHDNDHEDISSIQILPTYGEIMSERAEYLPSTNFLQPHIYKDPFKRYIDTNFRLLRHDVFGSVNEVLFDLLHRDTISLSNRDTRAHLYQESDITLVRVNKRRRLEAIISFEPPHQVKKKALSEQIEWWEDSSRLQEGTLVCFLYSSGGERGILMLQVTRRRVKDMKKRQWNETANDDLKSSLVSQDSLPCITVRLATPSRNDLDLLLRLYQQKTQGSLVDFRGVIPATFSPILENLQRIQREGNLAFREQILPSGDAKNGVRISPPAYSRRPGFVFPLQSITKDGMLKFDLDPNSTLDSVDISNLEAFTGLDQGQCQGLIGALTREYALIQGPPGTGKSYLGVQIVRALLAVREAAKLGPIIVICYTNHALDQFLNHLLDVGVEKLIRIGGRSKCSRLSSKNLHEVTRAIMKTKVENAILGRSYSQLDECMGMADEYLHPIHQARKGPTWDTLKDFLHDHSPRIYQQFNPVDSEGFITVVADPLVRWLGKPLPNSLGAINFENTPQEQLEQLSSIAETSIDFLKPKDRWTLAQSWLERSLEDQTESLFEAMERAETLRKNVDNVHDEISRRVLQNAEVVGLTTTLMARSFGPLSRLGTKVVICEEAAEVMEAHVISAFMPGVEHFIQIGDHRQLRPQIQNYSLSLESNSGMAWQLDRSQFERRAVGEPGLRAAPVAQLNVQRRMRPDVSRLIRSVYPTLQDHEHVKDLPDVAGMRENVFWIDHRAKEDSRDDSTGISSHSNQWEVSMATALVRHLVRQGKYSSEDIALLTPYTGQLRKLRSALARDFEVCLNDRDLETLAAEGLEEDSEGKSGGEIQKPVQKKRLIQSLRLATVDNFQGEEAKVIIMSLVRSNDMRKVGFLRTENRINVLLSRAKHGMYLIGNSETYQNVPMWADVYGQLLQSRAVSTEIGLCCPRHPEEIALCSQPEDFERKSPEGGCTLPCGRRLEPCGHNCRAPCHSDALHNVFSCNQPCQRIRQTCDHPCLRPCNQECGDCLAKVHDVMLPCGHKKETIFCHQNISLEGVLCHFKIEKTVPKCGHHVTAPCCTDVNSAAFRCPQPCTEILSCGHTCAGSCDTCRKEDESGNVIFKHIACQKACGSPYSTCNHRCTKPCHGRGECGSCESQCEVQCPHWSCTSICGNSCAPCLEKCTWSCPHKGSCSMPCAGPCDRLPCDERCDKILACGHQCPSFCGEECPNELCQKCSDKGDSRVDLLELKSYSDINLDDSPIVPLGCGHFFTGETLDSLIRLDDAYSRDKTGAFDGLKNVSATFTNKFPACPDCKRSIRQFATKRYSRVINQVIMDENYRRFMTKGWEELAKLHDNLRAVENGLQGTRNELEKQMHRTSLLNTRYDTCIGIEIMALGFGKKSREEHQPVKRLVEAITYETLSLEERMERLKICAPESHNQITLEALLIYTQARYARLHDVFALMYSGVNTNPSIPLPDIYKTVLASLTDCQSLAEKANWAGLSRIFIAVTLTFAKTVHIEGWFRSFHQNHILPAKEGRNGASSTVSDSLTDWVSAAQNLLNDASVMCVGLKDSKELEENIQLALSVFERAWFGPVTPEELLSIKATGVGDPKTHSGPWYYCANRHSFVIDECDMPTELAQCPECGASTGDRFHPAVGGVSRAAGR